MRTPVTPEDIDRTLATLDNAALIRIAEQVGPIPPRALGDLTPDQRWALHATNELRRRARIAEQAQGQRTAQLERQAVARRQRQEAQAAAELEPLLERKRQEYSRFF